MTVDAYHAIEVAGVSKKFKLFSEKSTTIMDRFVHPGRRPYREFWALQGIEFVVEQGDQVAVVGKNGSGKSTLLKCIAGILRPTEGEVRLRGSVSSLLELGAGFQPELTGRENIFLNASLLGLSQREVTRRFDDIVAFAELEQFIDNQVKYYSSGMYVRLGFAVAINVSPDILIVDEVLAVGDESFQHKCLDAIKAMQEEGVTLLFVTHSPDLAQKVCERAILLEGGSMTFDGPAGEVMLAYHERLREEEMESARLAAAQAGGDGSGSPGVTPIRIAGAAVEYPGSETSQAMMSGGTCRIAVEYEAAQSLDDAVFVLDIRNHDNVTVLNTNTDLLGFFPECAEGVGRVGFTFESLPLAQDAYSVSVAIQKRTTDRRYDAREQLASFSVAAPSTPFGVLSVPVAVDMGGRDAPGPAGGVSTVETVPGAVTSGPVPVAKAGGR